MDLTPTQTLIVCTLFISVGIVIAGFLGRARTPPKKLSYDEALRRIDMLIGVLDGRWESERLPSQAELELLTILQDFREEATSAPPDVQRLLELRAQLKRFLLPPKMKGLYHAVTYADSIIESYGSPFA